MADRVPVMSGPSDAHRAAIAWACEMTALESAATAMADRHIFWLDFDRFLEGPAKHLLEAAAHFGFNMSEADANAIAAGPLLRRYSKALEHDYSPALRQELQADARRRNGAAIESALAMLDEASRDAPLLAQAIERSAGRE